MLNIISDCLVIWKGHADHPFRSHFCLPSNISTFYYFLQLNFKKYSLPSAWIVWLYKEDISPPILSFLATSQLPFCANRGWTYNQGINRRDYRHGLPARVQLSKLQYLVDRWWNKNAMGLMWWCFCVWESLKRRNVLFRSGSYSVHNVVPYCFPMFPVCFYGCDLCLDTSAFCGPSNCH